MAHAQLRDILPLAGGLMATAVLSFALGGLTTVWLLQGSTAANGGAVVAAALPMPERGAALFDPDGIERDSAPLAVVRWTGGGSRRDSVQQEARKPAGEAL